MKNLFILLVISALGFSAEAKPRNQRREARQEARIQQGAQSGQLTDREQAKLDRGQARVDKAQDRAAADGVVTDREKVKLEKMQDHQSRQIYREKHDNQTEAGNINAAEPKE